MKKTLLFLCAVCLITLSATAQQYRWVKGGGSNCNMNPSRNWEAVLQMCTDANRNVYALAVVGDRNVTVDTFFRIQGGFGSYCDANIMLASYNCNGQLRWAKLIDSYGDADGYDVTYDNAGNVYLVGRTAPGDKKYFGDTTVNSINYNSFIIKYDTSGKMKWLRFLGADNFNNQMQPIRGGQVCVDAQGNPHFIATVRTGLEINSSLTAQAGTYDFKYTSSGSMATVTRLQIDSNWVISSAELSNSGKLYTSMNYNYNSTYLQGVMGFSNSGNRVWLDTAGGQLGIANIAHDNANGIFIAGGGNGGGTTATIAGLSAQNSYWPVRAYSVLAKIDTNGSGKWIYHLDCSLDDNNFRGVTILPDATLALDGLFVGTLRHGNDSLVTPSSEGQNPFFAIVDATGNTVKLDQLHGNGFYDWAKAITSDNAGNVYIGGMMESNITATGLGSGYNSTTGNTDFFIMKYGYACNCTVPVANYSSGTASGKTVQYTYSGTTTALDSLVWNWGDGQKQKVTTGFTTPISHTFTANGKYNVCVTAYTQCGTNSYCKQSPLAVGSMAALGAIKVYPNPAANFFTVEGAQGATATLTNSIGQRAMQFPINTEKQVVDIASLLAGVYILQLTDAKGNRGVMSIVKK